MAFDRSISLFLSCLLFLTSCGTHINHNSSRYYNIEEAEDYSLTRSKDFIAFHYFVNANDTIYELTEVLKEKNGEEMIISGIPQPASFDHLAVKQQMDTIPLVPVSEIMISYIPQIHLKLKTGEVKIGERIQLTDANVSRITVYYYKKDQNGTATAIVVGGLIVLAGLIIWGLNNMSFNYSN